MSWAPWPPGQPKDGKKDKNEVDKKTGGKGS